MLNVMELGSGGFGRCLCHEGGALRNGISALIRRDMRELVSFLTALHRVRMRRQLSANQEASSHQVLDLLAP